MVPRRTRTAAVAGVLVLAPITAELIQAYLGSTGDLAATLVAVVFLAPLYGGAALVIREVSVITGRGWPGRLLLAAAFGVLMTTIVDGSLFTPHRPEIPYWDTLVGAATVGGVSLFAAQSWIVGHAVMSIGAPLAVIDGALPSTRGQRLLGRVALGMIAACGVAVAWSVHLDPSAALVVATPADRAAGVAVALALVAAAMTRVGRPLSRAPGRRAGRPWTVGVAAFVVMATRGAWPSWPGLILDVSILAVGAVVVTRRSRSREWTPRHEAAVVTGVLIASAAGSFLNPVPDGADPVGTAVQRSIVLGAVVLLGIVLSRRASTARSTVER